MTTNEPDPQPREDVDPEQQGEPDDDIREALAEPEDEVEADSEGGEAS